jgi:hypothetical protein
MRYWLIFFACLAAPVWAQQKVDVMPSLVERVSIVLVNPTATDAFFSFRISNNTRRNITQIVIRYDDGSENSRFVHTYTSPFRSDQFEPGTTYTEIMNGSSQGLASAPYVRVTLDSVRFEDGEVAGPDASNDFAQEKAHQDRALLLAEELRILGLDNSESVLALLDEVIAEYGLAARIAAASETPRRFLSPLDRMTGMQLKYAYSIRNKDAGELYFRFLDQIEAERPVWRRR